MAKHRQKRRQAGEKQVTAYLSAEASALLEQMVEYSRKSQGYLLSEALIMLSMNYEFWDVRPPRLDDYDSFLEPDSTHIEDWGGRLEQNPNFDDQSAPPWIVEQERLAAAERRAWKKEEEEKPKDEFSVYRKGTTRNR